MLCNQMASYKYEIMNYAHGSLYVGSETELKYLLLVMGYKYMSNYM